MILVYNAGDQPVKVGDNVNVHEVGFGKVANIDYVTGVHVNVYRLPRPVLVLPKNIGARWIEGDAEPTLDELFARLQKAQAVYYTALHKEMKKWLA